MACDFEHPCGGRILPDLEFNTAMERAGISVRRGSCLLGAHSLYAYRVHVTACLHGHAPGEHHLAELRACGVCKVRHLIPGCSVCTGARAVDREEYEATLRKVGAAGHAVVRQQAKREAKVTVEEKVVV